MTAQELPDFDPGIIERFVENTYRKAHAVFMGSVVAGVMIGTVFGAIPLTSLGDAWPIPRMFGFATMILGAVVGGTIGYLIGDTRAFLARLHGQTALAQIHAANDARLALAAVREIQALAARRGAPKPAAPAAPLEAPPVSVEPAPQPVVQQVAPATVAPAAVAPAPVVAPAPTPVVHAVPDPAPVEPDPEPAVPVAPASAPATAEAAPAPLEAVPAPVEPAPAPPTLVVAAAAEPAPLVPPVSS